MRKTSKAKAAKTLKQMKKRRQFDSDFLRNLIKQKLSYAKTEREKGLAQIETLKYQVARLDGIILFIADLMESEKDGV